MLTLKTEKNRDLSKTNDVLKDPEQGNLFEVLRKQIVDSHENMLSEVKTIAKNTKVALVLGITGSGKSTLINYVTRVPLKRIADGDVFDHDNTYSIIVDNEKNTKKAAGIGKGVSTTIYPALYHDEVTKITYCDSPGFEATQGKINKISQSVSTELSVSMLDIRSILVILEYNTFDVNAIGKGKMGNELAEKFAHLFKDVEKHIESIIFVITKSPNKALENFRTHPEETVNAFKLRVQDFKKRAEENLDLHNKHGISDKSDEAIVKFSKTILASKNIIVADVLDNGVTRNTLSQMISKMNKQIEKGFFDFEKYDKDREKFDNDMDEIAKEAINYIEKYFNLPLQIKSSEKERDKFGSRAVLQKLAFSIKRKLDNNEQEIRDLKQKNDLLSNIHGLPQHLVDNVNIQKTFHTNQVIALREINLKLQKEFDSYNYAIDQLDKLLEKIQKPLRDLKEVEHILKMRAALYNVVLDIHDKISKKTELFEKFKKIFNQLPENIKGIVTNENTTKQTAQRVMEEKPAKLILTSFETPKNNTLEKPNTDKRRDNQKSSALVIKSFETPKDNTSLQLTADNKTSNLQSVSSMVTRFETFKDNKSEAANSLAKKTKNQKGGRLSNNTKFT